MLAFHASAAPRWATTRATAMATPDAAAHTSASDHVVPRAAGLTGGLPPLPRRQAARSSRRVTAADTIPLRAPSSFHFVCSSPTSQLCPGNGLPQLELTDVTFDEVVNVADVPRAGRVLGSLVRAVRQLRPVLEKVAAEQDGRLVVATLDVDDHPATYRRHDVLAPPTVVLFVDGRPRRRLVGARGRQELLEEIGGDLR